MPIYNFINNETGEVEEHWMSWKDKEQFLVDNPNMESIILKAPGLVQATGDRTKPPSGFKDVLSKVAEANPTSDLANTWGKKDAKSAKVREVTNKLKKKLGNSSE